MIVALFAVSVAMVIGGIAAIVQGFPFVRLESGLAMVIAGATVAAAGAVLFGLGVVAAGLRRVERAFDARRIVDAVGAVQDTMRAPVVRPDLPPVDPVPAVPLPAPRPTLPETGAAGPRRTEPSFAEAGEPATDGHGPDLHTSDLHTPDLHASDPHEPELPLPGLAPAPPPMPAPELERPEPAAGLAPEDDLFAAPEPGFADVPVLRPGLDTEHEAAAPELEPSPEPVQAAVAPGAPAVVGRYASGGNTYVMFADGAIEAETPQGRFTFASLDELKAFVDGGGEAGTRGAA